MKFYDLCEVCNFSEEPEIYIVNDDFSEEEIEWNSLVNKYVSCDYRYIYDEDEDIAGVDANIALTKDELDEALVLSVSVERFAKIRVRV